jgi:hypothetical protein
VWPLNPSERRRKRDWGRRDRDTEQRSERERLRNKQPCEKCTLNTFGGTEKKIKTLISARTDQGAN